MKIGLVGFPGSGKSTVFGALTGRAVETGYASRRDKANLAVVKVPDARVGAMAELYQPKKSTYAEITFTDLGSSPTTITNLTMVHYKSLWDRLRRKPDSQFVVTSPEATSAYTIPRMLHVGEEWRGLIEQNSEVAEMAKNGMLYADVHHSVRNRPARSRITIRDT